MRYYEVTYVIDESWSSGDQHVADVLASSVQEAEAKAERDAGSTRIRVLSVRESR